MTKPTLTLLSAIVIIGLTAYWFTGQQVQSTSQDVKLITKQETSSYRNPMNPVTTSPTPATDSVKGEQFNVSEQLATPNQPLLNSDENLHNSTSIMLDALKVNKTTTELELRKEPAKATDTTFSVGHPESENTMRITPHTNNSTMDVKK